MVLFLLHLASAIAINTYAIIVFEKIFSKTKYSFPVKLGIMFAAAMTMTIVNALGINLLNFTVSFLVLFTMAVIFNKRFSLRVAFFVMIFVVIMCVVEVFSSVLLGFILNVPTASFQTDEALYAASTVFNLIVMLAITKSFVMIASEKSIYNVRSQELIMFLILIIGEIVLLTALNDYFKRSKSRIEIIVVLVIFFAFDLYLTYLLRRIAKIYRTEKELDLVTQQSQLQLNAYKALNEKYNASRRVIHDVKKHLASLDGLINANQADEAEHYKELLTSELNKLMPRFECDNAILTVVINNKLEAADKQKIDFRVDAEYTEIDFISNLDITAIFSNLLDNAFEACSELPEEKRSVSLSIKRHNHFVFILMENSFKNVVTDGGEHFRSTKMGHQGIGMSNIKSACEKYSGSFNAHTEKEQFITEILIPIPDDQL
ncbi:MAG: GHKL domain-containing protein [Ruminococcus sp.]|uniref:sensor histidine kinase n=1 Tax=Ruminococcus sp. TaxID=41978 RepID=UPI0025D61397|nr:sensor histidine kinase [Ruminococcus sp.]MBR5682394.1 GHKL domain-containing protein [Ruminococcus sp.]